MSTWETRVVQWERCPINKVSARFESEVCHDSTWYQCFQQVVKFHIVQKWEILVWECSVKIITNRIWIIQENILVCNTWLCRIEARTWISKMMPKSAISATAVQPFSAAHCGIGRRETLRASTQIAYTRARYLLDCCHWLHLTSLPPPDSSAAAPLVPKNKNSEVARRPPDGLGTDHTTQSFTRFSGC